MHKQILEQLQKDGKITAEDIQRAISALPAEWELGIIHSIWDSYCHETSTISHDEELEIWVSHFLPILREEAFKVVEKVREMEQSRESTLVTCEPLQDPSCTALS